MQEQYVKEPNRSYLEIMAEIAVMTEKKPSGFTRIMYSCGLSTHMTKKYLSRMEHLGMLRKVEWNGNVKTKPMWVLTEKGQGFLQKFVEMMGIIMKK